MSDLDDILYQLGVYPTQRGYHITAVALRCSCSSAAVERNLRATANRAWDTNSKLVSQIAQRELTGPPTAGDFVWMLCRHLSAQKKGA